MGAVHKYDLTSDVTHLIVGDADTPKYKFVAKERPDVKCLLATWVEALRESWMEGGEPDVQALESRYKLPTLHNLRVCVTGFEDMAYRKKLEDDVNTNGGKYRANLTKDVTHLIAKDPSGAKYKYAMEWNIKIVAVEWLEQSLERGMILDESLYSLFLSPPERGHNAWIRRVVSASSLGKRSFEGDMAPNGPRKLRRSASTKLSSQNFGLWTDIVNGEIQTDEVTYNEWSEQPLPSKSTVQAASSATSKSLETPTENSFLRSESSGSTNVNAIPSMAPPPAKEARKVGIFAGKRLLLHNFNEKKTSVLHDHLLSQDAEILPDYNAFTPCAMSSPDNEFLLVPHDLAIDQIPIIPETVHQPVVVTDMWVERILHRKRYIRPEANVTNTPFRKFSIPGFERLVVCSTRFEGVDLLHVSRAVKLMGATYNETFSEKASVLVCNEVVPGHLKLRHAQLWNIPTVNAAWLWDCIRSGSLLAFEPYLVQPYSASSRPQANEAQRQEPDHCQSQKRHGTPGAAAKGSEETARAAESIVIHERTPNFTQLEKIKQEDPVDAEDNASVAAPIPSVPDPVPPQAPITISGPLREITPNSSPPKPLISPSKPLASPNTSATTTKKIATENSPRALQASNPSLASAITSFLAQHQNARSSDSSHQIHNKNTNPIQNQTRSNNVRRKRQLFGRAPSNASNLSRASSVDTVNTDGIGTPLELTRSVSNTTITNHSSLNHVMTKNGVTGGDAAFDLLTRFDDSEREPEICNDGPQLTQLGYEDPDATAWRMKVEQKLGGGVIKAAVDGDGDKGGGGVGGGMVKVKEIGRVKD
ncbi:MAG: hypothetical protein Q9201_007254, partial [Fulgogasparrea decipioides]